MQHPITAQNVKGQRRKEKNCGFLLGQRKNKVRLPLEGFHYCFDFPRRLLFYADMREVQKCLRTSIDVDQSPHFSLLYSSGINS
jgi:hypothetical protein